MKKTIHYYVSLGGFVSRAVYGKGFDTLNKAKSFAQALSNKEELRAFPVLVEKYDGDNHKLSPRNWPSSDQSASSLIAKWINGQETWVSPRSTG